MIYEATRATPVGPNDVGLLEVLASLAEGGDDEDDFFSSGIVEFLPTEVQLEDPPVKNMIDECGLLWDEIQKQVQLKHRMHRNKLKEMIHARELHNEKAEEAKVLRERVQEAKHSLYGKLESEYLAEQRLRLGLGEEATSIGALRSVAEDTVSRMLRRDKELTQKIWDEDRLQARLMQQLQAFTDEEERLRWELEQAQSVMVAQQVHAEGIRASIAAEEASAYKEHTRLRSEIRELVNARQPSSGGIMHAIFGEPEDVGTGADDDAVDDGERARRAQIIGRRYRKQRVGLDEMRQQLLRSEISIAQMESQLDQLEALLAASAETFAGVALAALPSPPVDTLALEGVETASATALSVREIDAGEPDDVVAMVREAEALARHLGGGGGLQNVVEEERRLREWLEREVEDITVMQEELLRAEESCEQANISIQDLSDYVTGLQSDVHEEQETLREEEWTAERRRQMFRTEVDEQRSILQQQRSLCRQLEQSRKPSKSKRRSAKSAPPARR